MEIFQDGAFPNLEYHFFQVIWCVSALIKPRSHEGLRPCCDLCKTSHVVKSQVDLIRARDRS